MPGRDHHEATGDLAAGGGAGSGGSAGNARRNGRLAHAFAVASLLLVALYPFVPTLGQVALFALQYLGSAACVVLGRRAVRPGARLPWHLILAALPVLVLATAAQVAADPGIATAGWLLGTVGNLLAVAAGLRLVLRRGVRDLGGLLDAALIGFAVGGLLWAVLPPVDGLWAKRLHLVVVVFVLPATLGPLTRLLRGSYLRQSAIWWLLAAITLALAGQILDAVADQHPALHTVAGMAFLLTGMAIGLFALTPSGIWVSETPAALAPERLSTARLVLLGLAVSAVPAIGLVAAHERAGWPLLIVQGLLISGLVMVRIGMLSTERERAEQTLEYWATHDPLTHLPNRQQLVDGLRNALAAGTPCALLFCDLDGFKAINDQYGHDAGDQILEEVAHRLRQNVRPPDFVSRIGGDEFVILLVGANEAQAAGVRDRVAQALTRQPYRHGGVRLRASIGIAAAAEGTEPEHLLQAADKDMYRVKEAARRAGR